MQAKFSRARILNLVLIMEAGLLLISTLWCWFSKIDLLPYLKPDNLIVFVLGAGLGLVMSGSSLGFSVLAHKYHDRFDFLASFEEFVQRTLTPIFSEVNPLDILLISLSSGFCEEIFFRGVMQEQFGLLIASAIFGLFHFAGRRFLFYVFWAALAGAALGLAKDFSHSLWVPVTAHIVNNFMSITLIRYQIGYKSQSPDDQQVDGTEPLADHDQDDIS